MFLTAYYCHVDVTFNSNLVPKYPSIMYSTQYSLLANSLLSNISNRSSGNPIRWQRISLRGRPIFIQYSTVFSNSAFRTFQKVMTISTPPSCLMPYLNRCFSQIRREPTAAVAACLSSVNFIIRFEIEMETALKRKRERNHRTVMLISVHVADLLRRLQERVLNIFWLVV